MSREDALHWAVCEAVACLNIGEDYQANYILRTALVEYADAPQAPPAECNECKATPCAVPEGYALVPVDPTEAMLNAARDWSLKKYGQAVGNDGARGCYAAMLAATPAQQPAAAVPEVLCTCCGRSTTHRGSMCYSCTLSSILGAGKRNREGG